MAAFHLIIYGRFWVITEAWIGHVPVLNVRCTWEDHIVCSQDASMNEALLAELSDAIEPEDVPVDPAVEALFDQLSRNAPKPAKNKRR